MNMTSYSRVCYDHELCSDESSIAEVTALRLVHLRSASACFDSRARMLPVSDGTQCAGAWSKPYLCLHQRAFRPWKWRPRFATGNECCFRSHSHTLEQSRKLVVWWRMRNIA